MIKVWVNYPGHFHDALVMVEGRWVKDRLGRLEAWEGFSVDFKNPSKRGRRYTVPVRSILYLEDWGDDPTLLGFGKTSISVTMEPAATIGTLSNTDNRS